jgi:glycosyltransferase involved in cell wall biosynthesis
LAKEMLDEQTGVILTTGKESELAEHAIRILKNPELKKEMSNNAFLKTRNTTWQKVGQKHANLFYNILEVPVFKHEISNQFVN